MIAEKSVTPTVGDGSQRSESTGAVAFDRSTVADHEVVLTELAAQIRADASRDAVFYLVRSNTSYDGE